MTLWKVYLPVLANHFFQDCLTFWSGHQRSKLKSIVKEEKNPKPKQPNRTELNASMHWSVSAYAEDLGQFHTFTSMLLQCLN